MRVLEGKDWSKANNKVSSEQLKTSCGCEPLLFKPGGLPMGIYPPETAEIMRRFYRSLNEKDRRRYAGIEALKLGHGGRNYIAKVLGISRRTVSRGAQEVSGLSGREVDKRLRVPGGGRKSYQTRWEKIDEKFLEVLHDHTAGSPMDDKVRWTDLTQKEILRALREDHGVRVSRWVVRRLLKKHDYRRRQAQKRQTLKSVPNRNAQFENIERLVAEYRAAGNPIISMDTKKKEQLGNFYRAGKLYTLEELTTLDHYIQLGTSRDTSEFACDSFRYWWNTYGRHKCKLKPE